MYAFRREIVQKKSAFDRMEHHQIDTHTSIL